VIHFENLLGTLHSYFVHSLKIHVEFTKLVEILGTKGNKILQNVKTKWIVMLSPTKKVMTYYITLLVKMVLDSLTNQ